MPLPHVGIFTRLAPSSIHGVGVFAILPIPALTPLFENVDDGPETFVPDSMVQALPPAIKKLYLDFAIKSDHATDGDTRPRKNMTWWMVQSFDSIGVAWYVNHSKDPNIIITRAWDYVAIKDIAEGEELTVDYDTYSPMET
jgi:hypothetical protein